VDGTSQWQTSISPVGALGLEHVGTAADLRSTEHSKIYEDSRKHQIVYDVFGKRNHWFLHVFTVFLDVGCGMLRVFKLHDHFSLYSMEFLGCLPPLIRSSKVSKGSLQGVGGPLQRTLQLHKDWVWPPREEIPTVSTFPQSYC